MWNLRVQTAQHRFFIPSYKCVHNGWIRKIRNCLTKRLRIVSWSFLCFLSKGTKTDPIGSDRRRNFLLPVVCFLYFCCNTHLVSAKTVVFCSIHVCICDFNRDTWRCFQSLVFWGLFVCLFFICCCCFGFFFHLRPNWGLSLALQSPEKMDSKDLVVLWTSWHFSFIVLCHMPFFCMLANWHSLAIFKKKKKKQNKKTDHGEAYSSNNGTAWKLCICCLCCWNWL